VSENMGSAVQVSQEVVSPSKTVSKPVASTITGQGSKKFTVYGDTAVIGSSKVVPPAYADLSEGPVLGVKPTKGNLFCSVTTLHSLHHALRHQFFCDIFIANNDTIKSTFFGLFHALGLRSLLCRIVIHETPSSTFSYKRICFKLRFQMKNSRILLVCDRDTVTAAFASFAHRVIS
jgi:hypothetical protein